ncbi:MAG: ATP-binding cassette domain-containing protein [Nitrososphaerota archaeon]
MSYAVDIRDYSLTFLGQTHKALKSVNLKVREGEILGIVGTAGSGKTSLLLSLNGVIPNDIPAIQEGSIMVDGVNVLEHDVSFLTRYVGLVLDTQDNQVLAATVYDDVAFGPSNLGLPRDEILRRVDRALVVSRLKGKELRNPLQLSGGEQQSLAIAGVLAMDPPIIAFDEPLSMLDPAGKETVLTVLRSIARERSRTVIVTESGSDLESTLPYFDRVVALKDGEVVAEGNPEEVVAGGVLEEIGVGEPQVSALLRRLARYGHPVRPTANMDLAASQLSELVDGRSLRPFRVQPPESGGDVVLRLENVRHVYPSGVEALKGVSLEVRRGDMIGLVGSNGSGKTTLCMHAVGVLKPTNPDGKVLVMGHDTRILKLRDIIRQVNYVYQLPDHMLFQEKVEDEIAFGPNMLGFTIDETRKAVDEMLELFTLSDYRGSYIFHLPRNVKRLLSLACVVATKPSILLVDEPTTGLDRKTSEKVMTILKELNRGGVTIIIISHNMELVGRYCRRVVVMDDGRILADGPTKQVFTAEDVLRKANLRPPQVMRLFKSVPPLSAHPVLSVDEAMEVLGGLGG